MILVNSAYAIKIKNVTFTSLYFGTTDEGSLFYSVSKSFKEL